MMTNFDARRERILQTAQQQGKINVTRLARTFGVSTVTIRTDLRAMAAAGLLTRHHGGARLASRAPAQAPGESPAQGRHDIQIAERAARLIQGGDKLILDAGNSTSLLARCLPPSAPLTVFTNSLAIINELSQRPGLQLIVAGGTLSQASLSLQGPPAESSLQSFNFDKLFLDAAGFDLDFGLSVHDADAARLSARMVERAGQVIVLADSTRIGQRCLHRICSLDRVRTVVSDAGMPADWRSALEARGIEVLLAGEA